MREPHPPLPPSVTGGRGQRLRADPAEVHVPQPPGAGSAGSASERFPDQPNAQRPQPRGLRQRAGDFPKQAPLPTAWAGARGTAAEQSCRAELQSRGDELRPPPHWPRKMCKPPKFI